jgi:hypothetical protein
MEQFRNTLEDCGLDDLGCEGDMFTWRNNHHKAAGYIKERLDRAVACNEWRGIFPLVRVINGDPRNSDHRPIIVECGEKENSNSFVIRYVSPKFEAKWLEEQGCWEKVQAFGLKPCRMGRLICCLYKRKSWGSCKIGTGMF